MPKACAICRMDDGAIAARRAVFALKHAVIPGQADGLSPEPRTNEPRREGLYSDSYDSGIGSGFRALRYAKPRNDGAVKLACAG